jgi:multidrug efflux pump subunit AcrA (membrane-fusion protein)
MLTTVDDNTGLELYVNVPVQEGPRLKVGLPMKIMNEAGEVVASDRVEFISPSVNDDTQTVLVKAPLATKAGLFRADQFVRVRIIWALTPGLSVPITAVNRINGQYFVFVAEAGAGGGLVARQKQVTIGPVLGNEYVVTGGLTAGMQLIVSGIQKIGDGAPVMAAPPGGAPPPPAPAGRGGEGK